MKIYQFIKYNQETKITHVKNYGNENLIVCFDFEDGIQNGLDENLSIKQKEKYREYFIQLLPKFSKECKIGVRINTKNNSELDNDLLTIKGKSIHSIFLPKIESSEDLINVIRKIQDYNIKFNELIPIIESKNGLENIEQIIKVPKIKNIAFGHCDYNLSLNIFPFFHHNSYEYWKWVNKIISITNKENITFINSPYLPINNLDFYTLMINHLEKITNNNFGQITLLNIHTEVCVKRKNRNRNFEKLLKKRYQLYETFDFAKSIVDSYELNNQGLGLSHNVESIISYQEYLVAKEMLSDNRRIINITFVGGCFSVQHNILYEDIFLVKSKKHFENKFDIKLNIDIIRYERFTSLKDKIVTLNKSKKIDILIFSVRPEPFLRIIKFYYKYINDKGELRKSLNLPLLNVLNPEKYDFLILGRLYDYTNKRKKNVYIHNILIFLNYLAGALIGNLTYALNKYIKLVKNIDEYCTNKNIKLVLLGPNLRNNNKIEPYFCRKLDNKIRTSFPEKKIINGLDILHKNKSVFHENGIHVNENYHDMIAKRINNILIELLSPTKNIVHLADSAKNEYYRNINIVQN